MEPDSIQVDPKEREQLDKIDPIDDTQAEKLLNTRYWPCGFYLAEPGIGNIELRAAFGLCDLPAIFFDLARGDPEVFAYRLELLSRSQLTIATLTSSDLIQAQQRQSETTIELRFCSVPIWEKHCNILSNPLSPRRSRRSIEFS